MAKEKWTEKDLENIYLELAESVLKLSDVETVDELTEWGVDCSKAASRIRQLIQKSKLTTKKQLLEEANREYNVHISAMNRKSYNLPPDPNRRRELLVSVLARRPDMRNGLTAQFRDFHDLSDEDVALALKQLDDLGLL